MTDTPTRPAAGEALALFITESPESTERLAAKMGIATKTLYNWIHGVSRISLFGSAYIEAWTGGSIPAVSWLDDETAAKVDALRAG